MEAIDLSKVQNTESALAPVKGGGLRKGKGKQQLAKRVEEVDTAVQSALLYDDFKTKSNLTIDQIRLLINQSLSDEIEELNGQTQNQAQQILEAENALLGQMVAQAKAYRDGRINQLNLRIDALRESARLAQEMVNGWYESANKLDKELADSIPSDPHERLKQILGGVSFEDFMYGDDSEALPND